MDFEQIARDLAKRLPVVLPYEERTASEISHALRDVYAAGFAEARRRAATVFCLTCRAIAAGVERRHTVARDGGDTYWYHYLIDEPDNKRQAYVCNACGILALEP